MVVMTTVRETDNVQTTVCDACWLDQSAMGVMPTYVQSSRTEEPCCICGDNDITQVRVSENA